MIAYAPAIAHDVTCDLIPLAVLKHGKIVCMRADKVVTCDLIPLAVLKLGVISAYTNDNTVTCDLIPLAVLKPDDSLCPGYCP